MMDQKRATYDAQAIEWVIRQRDPAFDDWDGFAEWLGADPAHADAYHAVAAVDADMTELPRQPLVQSRPRPTRRAWLAGGAAVAAAAVGLIGYGAFHRSPDPVRIATAPGERRTVALADGSTIAMNGDTRIVLDRDRPRFARLEQGEAMFRVVHRRTDPFAVVVGDATLLDAGTAFGVVRRARSTHVAVSEGAVVYNPSAENVRIDAGRQLEAGDDSPAVVLSPVAATVVGGWQRDQLVYDGAPLSTVVEDLARGTGIGLTLAPGLADLPFRGVLRTGRDEVRMVGDLAALAGLRAERRGRGWHLARAGT